MIRERITSLRNKDLIKNKDSLRMTKEALKKKAQALPALPGVYLMEDMLGNIIYVGKSKALKRRVSSYFSDSQKLPKVERMVRCIHNFSVQLTDTELDALILECRLIKKYKPLYNRLLKQDHKYRYLCLNPEEERPRVRLVREQTEKGHYFGPYEKGQGLFEAILALNEYYELPDCKRYESREGCLTYKRQKCLGPCKKPFDEARFKQRLMTTCLFLQGEDDTVIKFYEAQMEEAAAMLEFEQALALKQKWQALKSIHFRREAIEFATSNQVTLLLLDCPAGGEKLSLWVGATMIWSKVMKKRPRGKTLEQVFASMKRALVEAKDKPDEPLRKEAIDEAQIVYSMFKKQTPKTCQFFERSSEQKANEEVLQRIFNHILG